MFTDGPCNQQGNCLFYFTKVVIFTLQGFHKDLSRLSCQNNPMLSLQLLLLLALPLPPHSPHSSSSSSSSFFLFFFGLSSEVRQIVPIQSSVCPISACTCVMQFLSDKLNPKEQYICQRVGFLFYQIRYVPVPQHTRRTFQPGLTLAASTQKYLFFSPMPRILYI